MKTINTVLFLSAFLLLASSPSAAQDQPIAFTNVTVIDVVEGVDRPDMTVIVSGDRITAVSPIHSTEIPDGSQIIDGTGKYLIPGLWDMHTHIVSDKWVLPLLRVNGITGLRSMHGGERIHDVKEKRQDGNYHGFEFNYSSPIVDGPPGLWAGSIIAHTPEEGRVIVRDLYSLSYDFVKVYSNLSRETYFAIADESRKLGYPFAGHVPWSVTIEEAMAAGQKSIEHMVGLEQLVREPEQFRRMIQDRDTALVNSNGQVDLFKWFEYVLEHHDPARIPALLEKAGGADTWFCPTLVNLRASAFSYDPDFKADDRLRYIPEEELAIWQAPLESGEFPEESINRNERQYELSRQYYHKVSSLLRSMLDAGAKFLAGTDIGNPYLYPGFSLHDELALFVEAGFTPLEALQTATINPALYLNLSSDFGTVEEGKIANLILLDKDPLEDITNTTTINAVIMRGDIMDKEEIERILNTIVTANN